MHGTFDGDFNLAILALIAKNLMYANTTYDHMYMKNHEAMYTQYRSIC